MKKKFIIGVVILIVIVFGVYLYPISDEINIRPAHEDGFSNLQPMYGASSYEEYTQKRSITRRDADEKFVSTIVAEAGSVKVARDEVSQGAYTFLQGDDKDFDTAMKRCNQVWLIDHINFVAYWCYAYILNEKGEIDQSKLYSQKAISALKDSINGTGLSEVERPYAMLNLAGMYESVSDYKNARLQLLSLISKYPQWARDELVISLDKSLKEKGY